MRKMATEHCTSGAAAHHSILGLARARRLKPMSNDIAIGYTIQQTVPELAPRRDDGSYDPMSNPVYR